MGIGCLGPRSKPFRYPRNRDRVYLRILPDIGGTGQIRKTLFFLNDDEYKNGCYFNAIRIITEVTGARN